MQELHTARALEMAIVVGKGAADDGDIFVFNLIRKAFIEVDKRKMKQIINSIQ